MSAPRARKPDWLTTVEAADEAGVSRRTLIRARDAGELASVELSPGVVRFDRLEVQRYVQQRERDGYRRMYERQRRGKRQRPVN